MNVLQSAVLGLVQGLTEFLPISSSGHLVLVPYFLKWETPSVAFDVMLHFATLLAVIFYFWVDIKKLVKAFFLSLKERGIGSYPYRKLSWLIIVGTLPAAFAAILFKSFFAGLFEVPLYVAYFLLITGLLFVISEIIYKRYKERKDLGKIGWLDSIIVGFFQAAAVAPGVSRSGATIASSLFRGIRRDDAARFSFLLAVPIVLGATLDATVELVKAPKLNFNLGLMAGFLVALITGYLTIKYLLRYLKKHSLYVFACYCWMVGAATIVFQLLGNR